MPWSNNCYKLPRIADYAAAKKRFDGTAQPRVSMPERQETILQPHKVTFDRRQARSHGRDSESRHHSPSASAICASATAHAPSMLAMP